jgi:hypothetical protein
MTGTPTTGSARSGWLSRLRLVHLPIALLVAAFLGWVVWAGLGAARQPVRWQLISFDTRTPGEMRATVKVTVADAAGTVSCDVAAQDRDHRTVGIRTLTFPAGDKVRSDEVTVPVRGTPVAAVVEGCRVQAG